MAARHERLGGRVIKYGDAIGGYRFQL